MTDLVLIDEIHIHKKFKRKTQSGVIFQHWTQKNTWQTSRPLYNEIFFSMVRHRNHRSKHLITVPEISCFFFFFPTAQSLYKGTQIMQLEKHTKYWILTHYQIFVFYSSTLYEALHMSSVRSRELSKHKTRTVTDGNKRMHISALAIILSLTLISTFLSRLDIMSHLHPLIQDTKAARWVSRETNRISWYIIPAAHLIQCHSSMLLYTRWKGLYAA